VLQDQLVRVSTAHLSSPLKALLKQPDMVREGLYDGAGNDMAVLSGLEQGDVVKAKSQGFSLVELLIVVTIILIIAAIAIPNFLRSRVAANQASAVASLRTLNTAEFTYASTYGTGFSATLGYLGPPSAGTPANSTQAGIIDDVLSGTAAGGSGTMTSTKSGYQFTYSPGVATSGKIGSYTLNADPLNRGVTGGNSYFVDQTGVIRQNNTAQASAADSPLSG
jgi:type IV pilus assembly protein PilA